MYTGCIGTSVVQRKENKAVPESYNSTKDTINSGTTKWKDFFTDQNLTDLIDVALKNNQELNIMLQEINIAKYEVRARKGLYLPTLNAGAGAAVEKVGLYTSQGASDATNDITPGKKVPDILPNYLVGVNVSWDHTRVWPRTSMLCASAKSITASAGPKFH